MRGLRVVSDFEYEFHLANMNQKLAPRKSLFHAVRKYSLFHPLVRDRCSDGEL